MLRIKDIKIGTYPEKEVCVRPTLYRVHLLPVIGSNIRYCVCGDISKLIIKLKTKIEYMYLNIFKLISM